MDKKLEAFLKVVRDHSLSWNDIAVLRAALRNDYLWPDIIKATKSGDETSTLPRA